MYDRPFVALVLLQKASKGNRAAKSVSIPVGTSANEKMEIWFCNPFRQIFYVYITLSSFRWWYFVFCVLFTGRIFGFAGVFRGSYFLYFVIMRFFVTCVFVFRVFSVFRFLYFTRYEKCRIWFVFLKSTKDLLLLCFIKFHPRTANGQNPPAKGLLKFHPNHERLLQKARGPASHPTHINAYKWQFP